MPYDCPECGIVALDKLPHMRIYHFEEYNLVKQEFLEKTFMIGLDYSASKRAIQRMSGEDIDKELKERQISARIPPHYKRIVGKERDKALKWYKQKILLDARAKSIVNVCTEKLEPLGFSNTQRKMALYLIDLYTDKRIRSCYDEEVMAICAILVSCKFYNVNLKVESIQKFVACKSKKLESFEGLFKWMKRQVQSDKDYLTELLGN